MNRGAALAALTLALLTYVAALPTTADAQPSGEEIAVAGPANHEFQQSVDNQIQQIIDRDLRNSAATLTTLPGSSGANLQMAALALRQANLDPDMPLPEAALEIDPDYPLPTDDTITTSAILAKIDETAVHGDRVQRWLIASPAMRRIVEVQMVLPPQGDTPAPTLTLLDGVDAHRVSDWLAEAKVNKQFAGENVTLVMPTQARASLYADWVDFDPALGHLRWETFLTQELPDLIEAEPELRFNGRRGIAGLSMGATAAVRIANRHPDLYSGVIGISGCYSATDPLGYQAMRMIVESRGGSVRNLWGAPDIQDQEFAGGQNAEGQTPASEPEVTAGQRYMDTAADPEGLRNMEIYLSSSGGQVPEADRADVDGYSTEDLIGGIILEQADDVSSHALDQALRDRGIVHQRFDFDPEGLHNWRTFSARILPGWQHIKPALESQLEG